MRDMTKAVIGLGSIWGLFAFGLVLVSSFTIETKDAAPEIVAIAVYGLTILPACILAIWFRKGAAIWLIGTAALAMFGCTYQVIRQYVPDESFLSLTRGFLGLAFLAAVPGILGFVLLRSEKPRSA